MKTSKLFARLGVVGMIGVMTACAGAAVLYPVVVNGRWGFVDKSGKLVINPQFDRAEVLAERLAAVRLGRWGYVDVSGKVVINPQFDKADVFSDGLAAVKLGGGGPDPLAPFDPRPYRPFGGGGRYGYINPEGKYAINPQFEDAGTFAGGLAAVKLGGRWGFIDKTGKIVINPQFDEAAAFSDGLAAVKMGGRFGYTDSSGKLVINPQFERADSFSEGPHRQRHHRNDQPQRDARLRLRERADRVSGERGGG